MAVAVQEFQTELLSLMIIYLSGGAGGKEAGQTAGLFSRKRIGCLLAYGPGVSKVLEYVITQLWRKQS